MARMWLINLQVVVTNAQEIIGVSNIRIIDPAIIPEKPDRPDVVKMWQ